MDLKIILTILIVLYQILNSHQIVNNGNILTDGRWRGYYGVWKEFAIKVFN